MAVGEEDALAATAERCPGGLVACLGALVLLLFLPLSVRPNSILFFGGALFRCHLGNHFLILLGRIGANFSRVPLLLLVLGNCTFRYSIVNVAVQFLILIFFVVREEGGVTVTSLEKQQ